MEFKVNCVDETNNSQIKCEENKRKIIFINRLNILVKRIKVDNCQITDGLRCDYLVVYKTFENFIELKGENIKHAFKQLEQTIKLLGNNKNDRKSYIISSRSPLASPEIQNQRLLFKRRFNSELIVKNKSLTVDIE